jgi:hypothetical protein
MLKRDLESAHGNDGCDSSSNFEEPYKYSPYKNWVWWELNGHFVEVG